MKDLEYYMNLNYDIIISPFIDEGEKIYSARLKGIEGLEVFAYTAEEALNELEEAKELWFESCLKYGKRIPEPDFISLQ